MKRTVLSVCLACMASTAAAQSKGFYVGLSLGEAYLASQSSSNGDQVVVGARLRNEQQTNYNYHPPHGFLGDLVVGYNFNPLVALEFDYQRLANLDGTAHFSNSYSDGSTSTGDEAYSTKTRMGGLSLLGFKSLTPKLSLFGRVGAMWSEQEFEYPSQMPNLFIINNQIKNLDVSPSSHSDTERTWGAQYGLGLDYAFSQRFHSRIEARGVELKIGRAFELTVGLSYSL